jgi:hypothetical protein
MHLLEYNKDEELIIISFDDDKLPPYAILSHRWGEEVEEVSFEDIARNAGKDKSGYQKIRFCGEQAKRDNLQYFWIDTCCINKANKAEHSVAIRSMFRWYRNAARCYVYLSDVSALSSGDKREARSVPWDSEFRNSEWFTRGWTLQELLAPRVVEFFSRNWRKLGDRVSLKSQIHEVTTIPHEVLEGSPLFHLQRTRCLASLTLTWRLSTVKAQSKHSGDFMTRFASKKNISGSKKSAFAIYVLLIPAATRSALRIQRADC